MYIYYVTNSGLLIVANGLKLLADGIFGDKNLFNVMKPELEEDIIHSIGIFSRIDCLVFTHCHDDHFDGIKVRRYLENNPGTRLIVSQDALQSKEFVEFHNRMKNRIFLLDGEQKSYLFESRNMKLNFYKTKHLDNQIAECDAHYSLLIEEDQKRIFIAGDMELNDEENEKFFCNSSFDAVFFNPVVFCKKNWIGNFISINALNKFIYHIPSEENDRFYYRKMARYHYNILKSKLNNCHLLLNEMEKIEL